MATPGVVQEVVSVAAEHAERVDTDCAFPAEAVDALRKTGLLGLVLPARSAEWVPDQWNSPRWSPSCRLHVDQRR